MPVTEKFVHLYNEFIRPTRRPAARATNNTAPHQTSPAGHATSSANNATAFPTTTTSTAPGTTTTTPSSYNNANGNAKQYAQTAPPLLPEFFFDLLPPFSERTGIPYKDGEKVNQQDAQEFLTYILDLMHEEFLLFHRKPEPSPSSKPDEGWEEVGKKNKSSIVLTKDTYAQSVISYTFGGKQRSSVRKQTQGGAKPSVTIQPFYCLHLDIDKPHIKTLEDALDAYMEPEKLEGYNDVRGVEVQASKQTTLEALPRVLILHLKRFAYDTSQARKLDKFIFFPQKLVIKKGFLSNDKVAPDDKRMYSLCSVVEHHGKVAAKGHYTCDINKNIFSNNNNNTNNSTNNTNNNNNNNNKSAPPEAAEWLNFDDQLVRRVTPKDVQHRLAYLLFYVQN